MTNKLEQGCEEEVFIRIKEEFPIFSKKIDGHELVYLDTAATAQKPRCVIDAITDFYSFGYGTVHKGVYALSRSATKKFLEAREKVATFLGAFPEEVIFPKGATAALNHIARALSSSILKQGDIVLISEIEHHACEVTWRLMVKAHGLQLKYIPVDDKGQLILEKLEKLILEGARVINLVHVANVYGSIMPIEEVVALAQKYGVITIIDGTQSAPHLPINMHEMGIDVFVAAGHKLYGPTGVGILYVNKELLSLLPPFEGGGDMVQTVTSDNMIFHDAPLKFEAGTPAVASVIGLGEACSFLMNIGMQRIFERERQLIAYILKKLQAIEGVYIIGSDNAYSRGSLISFGVEGIHPLDIAALMDSQGIALRSGNLCSQPSMNRMGHTSITRLSLGIYNLQSDLDYFDAILRDAITFFNK